MRVRWRSPWSAFLHDLVMIPTAWLLAYWLRFNLATIPDSALHPALLTLPLLVVVQGAAFWYFGLYRGVWRFASMPDLIRIAQAVVVGALASAAILFLWTRMQGVPRSVLPIYAMLLLGLLGGPRFIYRVVKDQSFSPRGNRNVLIIGAGAAGEMLARDLIRNRQHDYDPVAFVDDNPAKLGQEIHGVRVLGSTDAVRDLVHDLGIDVILIALPSVGSREMRRIIELCEVTEIPFRIVPRLDDMLSGRTRLVDLREVSIEDLLGRDPVTLDWASISRGLGGRRVLITGGGGSIGSELCRQIGRLSPAMLVVVDHSEFNLYTIEMELRAVFPQMSMHFRLLDVTDGIAVERVFAELAPQVVFHAAAYKHVPMLQNQVREAVQNNVLGTERVALAADRHRVECFVLISTDKAVNPTSVMGTTKRVGEIFCQNLNARSDTHFITVRFGNVLGSAGSVVPLFHRQIAAGGPVTVTHPEVTRYFMTIPEACQLIMQAAAHGRGGEIFVLDMGEPVKITYLAEQMIRLSGKLPGDDIEISFVGLRPGEKLYEELVHDQEPLATTPHQRILLARFREVDWHRLNEVMADMERGCAEYDEARLRAALYELVPECSEAQRAKRNAEVVRLPTGSARGAS